MGFFLATGFSSDATTCGTTSATGFSSGTTTTDGLEVGTALCWAHGCSSSSSLSSTSLFLLPRPLPPLFPLLVDLMGYSDSSPSVITFFRLPAPGRLPPLYFLTGDSSYFSSSISSWSSSSNTKEVE